MATKSPASHLLAPALVLCLCASPASAASAPPSPTSPSPENVITQLTERKKPINVQVQVTMQVLDASGGKKETDRKFLIQTHYEKQDQVSSVVSFEEPSSIKGTRILTVKAGKETGQWIYLPSFKKVNRVNSEADVEGVLDSDLSFSDLKGESLQDYQYRFNSAQWETHAAKSCGDPAWSIEATAKGKDGARRMISISKARNVLCDVSFVTGKRVTRSLASKDFVKTSDGWRPGKTVVTTYSEDGKTTSSTILTFGEWKSGLRLDPDLFSASKLGQ